MAYSDALMNEVASFNLAGMHYPDQQHTSTKRSPNGGKAYMTLKQVQH
jgi:hypothetical protein